MGLYLIAEGWSWLSPESWLAVLMTVVGLGLIIFVHELGHFLVAKLCGVQCDKFYVGFDVPIRIGRGRWSIKLPAALWKRKWGETEYGVGIIPLGGYVKMLGQDDNPGHAAESAEASRQKGAGAGEAAGAGPAPLDPRSYPAKSVPQRMAIISAGVVMNVIFAYLFALWAIGLGVPYIPCNVARTIPGQPAWREHLRPWDKLIEVNGLKNPRLDDLHRELLLADPNVGVRLVIQRGDETFPIQLKPDEEGTDRHVMPMIGVIMQRSTTLNPELPVVPNTPAAGLPADRGFEVGQNVEQKVVEVDGQPIRDEVDYNAVLARNPTKPLAITVERRPADQPDAKPQRATITVPANPLRHLGLVMTMGPITAVQVDSPATEAKPTAHSPQVSGGLKRGDRITRVDGQPAGDPMTLPLRLRSLQGKEVRVEVERPAATAGTPPETIEFTTRLTEPTWFTEESFEDCPVPWLALGATYAVEARVTAADDPQVKKERVGDKLVEAVFIPPQDPKTDADKLEAKIVGKMKPFEFGPGKRNWPEFVGALQYRGPKTRIKLKFENPSAKKPTETVLSAEEFKDLFNPDRGLNFKPNEEMIVVHSLGEAGDFAWRETKSSLLTVYISLKKLAYRQVSADQFGGPITIAAVAASSAKQGFSKFLLFLAFISANLAVVNFLPIPVLDGGHMMFLILEGIFRRPVSEKIVIPLTYAGLFFILTLMLFVFGLDIRRFWPF